MAVGWWRDPYDGSTTGPLQANLSEDRKYDAAFPDHPLSRARALLAHLESSIRLDDEVRAAAPFGGEAEAVEDPKKPWWKKW